MITKNFRYIYKGIFEDYESCLKKTKTSFYNSTEYKKKQFKIIDQIVRCLKEKNPIPAFYKQHTQYLALLISILKKKRKYKILDFGGGWGIGYANLLEVFDKKTLSNIDYHIYELTDLCDIGDKKFKKKLNLKHNLKYFDNLESIDKNYDIIFFGSSIQYLKDPLETLKEILLKNSEYIVLIDLYLTNSKTFFTRQQHYNFEAPHSFINLKQFENIFYKKYNIINKSYSHTTRLNKIGNLDMGNFEKKFRIKNSFNYIFKSK